MNRISHLQFIGLLALAVLVVITGDVLAQTTSVAAAQANFDMAEIFNPPGSDRTMRWLNVLFAPLLNDQVTTAFPSILYSMFEEFNLLILAVSTVFLGYNFTVGIMQTANDGEFLGKHWSGLWAPIRVGAALAMLFPLGSGFTMIQHTSIKIAVLGIGVADQLWKTAADRITNGYPVANFELPDASVYARDIFYSELCAAYLNSYESEVRGRSFIAVQAKLNKSNEATKNYTLDYSGEPGTSYPANVCGKYTLATADLINHLQALKEPDGVLGTSLFRSDPAPEVTDFMMQAQIDASMKLRDAMASLAFQIVDARLQKLQTKSTDLTYGNPDIHAATATLQQYNFDMQNAATQAQQLMQGKNLQKMKNDMLANGWSDAGVWWWTINKMNQSVAEAASAIPDTAVRVNAPVVGQLTDIGNFAELYNHAALWWSQVSYQPDQQTNKSWLIGMVDPMKTLSGAPTYSAFSGLMSLGNSMLYSAVGLFATGVALDVVGFASDFLPAKWGITGATKILGTASKIAGPGVGRFTDLVSSYAGNAFGFLSGLVGPLFIFGIILAIVLPLYPFFGFVAATISWLILVVEAVLAAPLWAFAHLRMDGHEFATEASKAGYRLSLNILMRPSLMLFGLVMSYIIFELFCGFMSERFTQTIYNINGGDTTITNVLYMIVFVAVIVIGASKSFSLITEIPDRVMRWVGVGGETRDEQAFTEGVRTAAHGGLAAVGGASLATGAKALKGSLDRSAPKKIGKFTEVQ